ncbi:MAG: M15 family metallopeptidase [Saprospiraceae bacterium]|nr:M15 family metallopeptidase [Saprospiraceae bacterium]
MPSRFLVVLYILSACISERSEEKVDEVVLEERVPQTVEVIAETGAYTDYEDSLLNQGFVDLAAEDSTLLVDLKYASSDNFLDTVLYGSLHHAFGVVELSEELQLAGQILRTTHPKHQLKVFDALRPRSIQHAMWEQVKHTDKRKYVAAPSGSGSMHNYGCAVDLTIVDSLGQELDMGSAFDFFGPAAEYRYNWDLLRSGELSQEQVDNRVLLRTIMRQAGFHSIDSEWWHFNLSNREYIKSKYTIVD